MSNKRKEGNWNFIKLKIFCIAKAIVNGVNRQAIE
jgi:hypothetical protein